MVGRVIGIVRAEVEDGLRSEVAERDVIRTSEGVLVNVHDEVVVLVPMLVAAGAELAINSKVHRRLEHVAVHVVEDARDFDVLFLRYGKGSPLAFIAGHEMPIMSMLM